MMTLLFARGIFTVGHASVVGQKRFLERRSGFRQATPFGLKRQQMYSWIDPPLPKTPELQMGGRFE